MFTVPLGSPAPIPHKAFPAFSLARVRLAGHPQLRVAMPVVPAAARCRYVNLISFLSHPPSNLKLKLSSICFKTWFLSLFVPPCSLGVSLDSAGSVA